jgi:hypothetical protein
MRIRLEGCDEPVQAQRDHDDDESQAALLAYSLPDQPCAADLSGSSEDEQQHRTQHRHDGHDTTVTTRNCDSKPMNNQQRAGLPTVYTLTAGEGWERLQRWRRLSEAAQISAQQQSNAVVVSFRASQQTHAQLEELAELERICCPFLAWDVTRQADTLVLRVAPAAGWVWQPRGASEQLRILAQGLQGLAALGSRVSAFVTSDVQGGDADTPMSQTGSASGRGVLASLGSQGLAAGGGGGLGVLDVGEDRVHLPALAVRRLGPDLVLDGVTAGDPVLDQGW